MPGAQLVFCPHIRSDSFPGHSDNADCAFRADVEDHLRFGDSYEDPDRSGQDDPSHQECVEPVGGHRDDSDTDADSHSCSPHKAADVAEERYATAAATSIILI